MKHLRTITSPRGNLYASLPIGVIGFTCMLVWRPWGVLVWFSAMILYITGLIRMTRVRDRESRERSARFLAQHEAIMQRIHQFIYEDEFEEEDRG